MTSGDADWRLRGNCSRLSIKESDALFFPPPGGKSKKAELFCTTCPVQRECLTMAMAPGTTGFWAGTTEGARKEMAVFVDSLPYAGIAESMPKEPTRRTRRLKSVPTAAPDRTLDLIEGPSFMEELGMLG